MAVYSGPEIVNSGLVLHLDAANPRSYPGTGTTWYDLSNKSANMMLTNGPSFTSGTIPYITFDGVNDYGSTTVEVPDSALGDRCAFECFVNGNMTDGKMLMSWGSGKHDIFITGGRIGFNSYQGDSYGISTTGLANRWLHFVFNFYRNDYTKASMYVNGKLQSLSTPNQNTNNVIFASGAMRIGAGGDNNYYGFWKYSQIRVYNRALTEAEIQQNFEATRTRYGV